MFKATYIHLSLSIFNATQRSTPREAAGPPWQAETRSREQKPGDVRGQPRGLRVSTSGTIEILGRAAPAAGNGAWPSPRSSPGEGAHPSSRSPSSRDGGRRRAGIPRCRDARGAGSAAAGGSARPRSAPGGAGGKRPMRGAAL